MAHCIEYGTILDKKICCALASNGIVKVLLYRNDISSREAATMAASITNRSTAPDLEVELVHTRPQTKRNLCQVL